VPDELPDDQRPKMDEAFQPSFELKDFIFRVGDGSGENFNEAKNPFAGHVAVTLAKPAGKSTARPSLCAGRRHKFSVGGGLKLTASQRGKKINAVLIPLFKYSNHRRNFCGSAAVKPFHA
jgi:hypothetical protein